MNQIYTITKELRKNKLLKQLVFGKKFIDEWEKALFKAYNNDRQYLFDLEIKDGYYNYKHMINEQKAIELNFNIDYLLDCYRKSNDIGFEKISIDINNGIAKYGGFLIKHNKFTIVDPDIDYENINKILLTNIGMEMIVIDGNHRLNYCISKGVEVIEANYVNWLLCCYALSSTFEIACFCLLRDIALIAENHEKIKNETLENKLTIFKDFDFNLDRE